MFGKNTRLTALEMRKQLLVAESELNRAQMGQDFAALAVEVRGMAGRAKALGSLASTAGVLVAGLTAFQRTKPAENGAKPSWFKTALRGAGLISTVWMAFRSAKNGRDEPPYNSGD